MLTGFQLKASIGILKIRVTDLAKSVALNRFTIAKLQSTPNTEYLRCYTHTLSALADFFKKRNILFLDDFSISLRLDSSLTIPQSNLTVFQLRGARAALGLNLVELGNLTNFSPATLSKLEQGHVTAYIKSTYLDIDVLRRFFNKEGISFPEAFTIRIDK